MIRRAQWSAYIAEQLRGALGEDLEFVRAEISRSEAALYQIDCLQAQGVFVLRLETLKNSTSELVIVAGAGRGWMYTVQQIIEAGRGAANSLRLHTRRKGIARWAEKIGFTRTGEGDSLRFCYGQ